MKANYQWYLNNMHNSTTELPTQDEKTNIHIGDKVKLNYEKIIHVSDYPNMTKEYKLWVEQNKDKIFTVEQDSRFKSNQFKFSAIVSLKEDNTNPKWLFSIIDLIKIGE